MWARLWKKTTKWFAWRKSSTVEDIEDTTAWKEDKVMGHENYKGGVFRRKVSKDLEKRQYDLKRLMFQCQGSGRGQPLYMVLDENCSGRRR